jgi:hypothetical protein
MGRNELKVETEPPNKKPLTAAQLGMIRRVKSSEIRMYCLMEDYLMFGYSVVVSVPLELVVH